MIREKRPSENKLSSTSYSPPYTWTFWRVVWAVLVLVTIGLGFWLLYRFHQVVFILFVAIVLGTVLRPMVAWLQRRGLPGYAGVTLIYLLLLGLFVGFVLLLVPLLVTQGTTIAVAAPGYLQSLGEWLVNNPNSLVRQLGVLFSDRLLSGQVPIAQTGQEIMDSAAQALGYAATSVQAFLVAGAILLIAYYWTLDGPRHIRNLLLLVPVGQRESAEELIAAMETKVGAYVAGQGVLMLVIAGMSLVAYMIIGLPYVLVLALVAGVMEAVPLVGPFLGALPAALVAASMGPDKLVWVMAATLLIQQLENNLLVPRVMRKAVGVNPFVALLAIFAFASLLGIPGALMAIPIAAIIQLILDRYVFHSDTLEPEAITSRDLVGRLRYEAQDLAQDLRKQARVKKDGSTDSISEIDEVMDEIESITTDLGVLLAQVDDSGLP